MAPKGSSSSSRKGPDTTNNKDTEDGNRTAKGTSGQGSHTADNSKHTPDLHVDTSFNGKGHRPSNPSRGRSFEGRNGMLDVPGSARDRQDSADSADPSQSNTAGTTSNTTTSVNHGNGTNQDIMNDENALKPDQGTEDSFKVEDNPFAFSPGQLSKMFDPKSLAAFYQLGGLRGLEAGLRTDRKTGLKADEDSLAGTVSFQEATSASESKANGPSGTNDNANNTGDANEKGDLFKDRLRVFKDNRMPARQGTSLLKLMWIALQDRILIMLSVAAVASLGIGIYQTVGQPHKPDEPKIEWVEGVAIMVAVAVVVLVSSLVDWSKEHRFAKLNRKKQDRYVKAVRSGKTAEISIHNLMAGDVVLLEPGDVVPADGVLIEGFGIKCDESSATGESDLIRKRPGDDVFKSIKNHEDLKKTDPFILSGAQITEGMGSYLVTATGVNSSYGKIMMAVNEDQDMTPLQSKLNRIALWIAKLGFAAAFLMFTVLFIKFCVSLRGNTDPAAAKGQQFLEIVVVVITIVVVAVPEGLPLAVTLALAYAMVRMLQDRNLVRHLKACEVMGNATSICSDKTGTLTQNEMRVVSGIIGTTHEFGGRQEEGQGQNDESDQAQNNDTVSPEDCISKLDSTIKDLLVNSIALNSTAFEEEDDDGQTKFNGSKTETALLLFARDSLEMGPVQQRRDDSKTLQLLPFDSGRKAMGVVVELPDGGARLYVKGASEIILSKCEQMLSNVSEGANVSPFEEDNKASISELIDTYARRSLRTIGIAYRDFESWPPQGAPRVEGSKDEVDVAALFEKFVFVGMVGIQDPLRPGVPESVALCQSAGVTVRMVTGDNKLTARAIAQECGILTEDGVVMEGPEFRNLSRSQQEEIIPRLQVLARSSPDDKRVLVKRLKEKDEVVAVTGDGTNDAPALTTADVGFSMGQAGTEVAKEASAIILMDDNFNSIVQALKWGRAVNDSVKKFLQFQLTVNITAVVLSFVTAVSSDDESSVLTAVQLLWVNLIMDTLGALALATDPPQDSILNRLPEPRKNFIITPTMWKMILGQAIYQLAVTFTLYYGRKSVLPFNNITDDQLSTLVFNTFVWMQLFNQWNNRRLDNRFNILEGILRNPYMMGISAFLCGMQVLIIFVGGAAFQIHGNPPQTAEMWAVALIMGFLSIPIGMLIRLIPDSFIEKTLSATWNATPGFIRRRFEDSPEVKVSDEEIGLCPDPLLEIRDELKFIRRMRGGRLKHLKFAVQHPRKAVANMQRSRSPSRSRSGSVNPQTPIGEDRPDSATTPDSYRRHSNPFRDGSSSALGATVVMAGIVAGGPAAGWSPAADRPDSSEGLHGIETTSRYEDDDSDGE